MPTDASPASVTTCSLGSAASRYIGLWKDDGTLLYGGTTTATAPGWNVQAITPINVTANQIIRVAYGYAGSAAAGGFAYNSSPQTSVSANLRWEAGVYSTPVPSGGDDDFPTNTITPNNYYADIVYQKSLAVITGHRYWRFTLDGTQPGYGGYTMAEVQFRTAAGVPLVPSGGTPSSFDQYNSDYGADKVCDGNPATMWSSSVGPPAGQWWGYTYPEPQNIVEIAITARGDGFNLYTQTPIKITPQWSDDGVTWTSLPQLMCNNWTGEGQTQVFHEFLATALPILPDIPMPPYTGPYPPGGMP